MTQLSVTEFLDLVERSGLVAKDPLGQAIADLEQDGGKVTDSRVVSSHLVSAGLLTHWQCDLLLQGRHRGFFVGRFRLLDHLGEGTTSVVYLGEHVVMGRRVAMKFLPMHCMNGATYDARFQREARLAAALDHPNIARALDVDHNAHSYYLVMEYLEGRDLKAIIEQSGPLPCKDAGEYIRQAALGLSHAHRHGLVHGNVKPSNLLLSATGLVKVLDLGLARPQFEDFESGHLTSVANVVGTPDFMAPEQWDETHTADARADLYALGCTFCFLLTGRAPFDDTAHTTTRKKMNGHVLENPLRVGDLRADVPPEIDDLYARLMVKDPAARLGTADELAQRLGDFLVERPT